MVLFVCATWVLEVVIVNWERVHIVLALILSSHGLGGKHIIIVGLRQFVVTVKFRVSVESWPMMRPSRRSHEQ